MLHVIHKDFSSVKPQQKTIGVTRKRALSNRECARINVNREGKKGVSSKESFEREKMMIQSR